MSVKSPGRWRPLGSGLAVLLLAGCAGYHLGPSNGLRSGARSIQVNPFQNKALEARLGEAVTSSLRKSLQKDGTYRLNSAGAGDIIVTGTILDYDRGQLSFQPRDVITPRDYRVNITAQVTARERSTGRILLDQKVIGHSTVRVGANLTSDERQALPLVADDLARNITSLLVDGEW